MKTNEVVFRVTFMVTQDYLGAIMASLPEKKITDLNVSKVRDMRGLSTGSALELVSHVQHTKEGVFTYKALVQLMEENGFSKKSVSNTLYRAKQARLVKPGKVRGTYVLQTNARGAK